jgi:Nucleotidyltransferase of unknown function (DUF6036)
MLAGPC